jgi:aspartyl-tRNA(Asn)/glutamyl-tRNA(Gln) amidotransferase subunit C
MIDKEQVRHVAQLARLKLSAEEEEKFTGQLGAILGYIEQLNSVDTAAIAPTSVVVSGHDALREDTPQPSLTKEQVLQNAPKAKKGFFAVPKIIN